MNKIGTIDIIKAYLGNKELSANNAYIGEISLIKGSGPTPVPVPNDEIWYTSSDGNIVTPYDSTALPTIVSNTYVDGKGIIKFVADVTSIGDYAFKDCSSLTSVTIGNSVTSIENYAFNACSSLISMIIGNGVTSIGDMAFFGCSGLTSVYISDIAAWCAINFNTASANPLNLAHNLYLNEILVTDLVIPNSVTSIGDWAFYNCSSLTSVTIPNSVTSIGSGAFGFISAKLSFTKLYSTYTNKIFTAPSSSTGITCNVEFNISEIPTGYNISSMLPKGPSQSNKGSITYNIYTDYAPCKDQALALADAKTIVNVYHIDGTLWE